MTLKTEIIDSVDELGDQEGEWGTLHSLSRGTPYSSFPFISSWLDAFNDEVLPRVVVVRDGRDLVGAMPMVLTCRRHAGMMVRTLSLIGGHREKLGCSSLEPLCPPQRLEVMDEIQKAVMDLDWNVITNRDMSDTAASRRYADALRGALPSYEPIETVSTACHIPATEEIVKTFSRRTRDNINSGNKKLDREGVAVSFRFVPVEEVERAVDLYAKQHVQRWTTRGGSMFTDPRNSIFLHEVMRKSIVQGNGYIVEILINGEVASQNFGFLSGDAAFSYRTGMSDAHGRFSPGLLLRLHEMEWLRSRGVVSIDLGAGTEEYKNQLGGQQTPLVGFQAKRGMFNALCKASNTRPVRFIDEKLGLKTKLYDGVYI